MAGIITLNCKFVESSYRFVDCCYPFILLISQIHIISILLFSRNLHFLEENITIDDILLLLRNSCL